MHRWIESLYEHSPVALQHVMISLYGWKLVRIRYGGRYKDYLEELMRSQRYSDAELAEHQNQKLQGLIRHCYENVPYYAKLFRELKLVPDDIQKPADLAKLPILSKEAVRRDPDQFYAQNYLRAPCEISNTSGTTGTTLRIRVNVEGRRENYAFFGRLKAWAGVGLSDRSATFAGRTIVPAGNRKPPFWRYNFWMHNLLFSSYHLSDKNVPAYLEQLRRWRPRFIDSYPSSIHTVARYMSEHGETLPSPRAIITSSETLWPEDRETICKALGAPVFDLYGGAEQVCFISQCEAGTYHIHPEFGVTELVPETSEPQTGFRIIATGFTNLAMPFLRYDTGDLAMPGDRSCSCGRNFQVVERILGRADDVIITPDGRRIGRLDPVFKGLWTIRKAQIEQETLNHIRLRVVPGKGFRQGDVDSVLHELKKRIGPEVEYSVEIVEDIAVGAGGKFRAVVSRVSRPEKTAPRRAGQP